MQLLILLPIIGPLRIVLIFRRLILYTVTHKTLPYWPEIQQRLGEPIFQLFWWSTCHITLCLLWIYHPITAPFRALSWWAYIYFRIILNKPRTTVAPTKNENPRAKKIRHRLEEKLKCWQLFRRNFFSRKLRGHFHGKEGVTMHSFASKLCMYSHYHLSGWWSTVFGGTSIEEDDVNAAHIVLRASWHVHLDIS